ncbi:hypothetical protein [Mesomycoplasma hyorhinis]|uniref:hypothetical protein n=1 Tax=Mesomycoplasma hyorhinis TaxID=2100 RepID=UPI001C059BAF|nr:hypothetical protein [Mesomycoplasma hyorhinis]
MKSNKVLLSSIGLLFLPAFVFLSCAYNPAVSLSKASINASKQPESITNNSTPSNISNNKSEINNKPKTQSQVVPTKASL